MIRPALAALAAGNTYIFKVHQKLTASRPGRGRPRDRQPG
jgi:hypothetical protein